MTTDASPNPIRPRSPRRDRTIRSVAAVVVGAATLLGASSAATVASAGVVGPVGCGYGTGGPFADTLCWIDMSGYVDATARSASGQAMSAMLPGGYTVDFTVRTSGTRPAVPSIFPTWDYGAAIGKYLYLGTPGQPALYQQTGQGAADTTFTLDGIEVTDSGGNPVHGWRFVGADAESTSDSESITFTSDTPVSTLATFTPPGGLNGCQVNITQIDANTISCTGSGIGDAYGTVLVGATEPTSFSQTMTVGNAVSREGVAFAFQSSSISLDAVVTGRVAATDSFDVSVVSPESTVVGSASTGTADTATTGGLVVLPRVDGSSYTLRETGTNLAAYALTWACTRDGVDDPSLAATGVDSITVSPAAGEDIACTVTNAIAPPPPTTTTTTTVAPTTSTTVATTAKPTTTVAPAATPTATSSGTLPATGSDFEGPLALVGVTFVGLGALAVRASRRRSGSST